jgi:lipopolysaccharide exporter
MPLAILYRNFWALVFGGFAARFLTVPLSYVLAPHRPSFSLAHVRELLNFSKWLFVNNFLTMIDTSVMTMTLGRLNGPRDLGLFQVSLDLAAIPASEIAAPIRAPMYAGYARVATDLPALREQVISGFALLLMVLLPMSVGIAVTSDYAAHVALGEKWADAGPIVLLCAFYALFDAIGHFTGNVYIVRDAQRTYVAIMALSLVLRVMLVVPAAMTGGVRAAAAMAMVSAMANAFLWFVWLRRLIHITWTDLARVTWRGLAAAALMAACVTTAEALWPRAPAIPTMILQWASLIALGATVHVGTQWLLWSIMGRPLGPEAHVLRTISPYLARVGLAPRV